MTLILGMSKPEGIYLSVDHRFLDPLTRKPTDDHAVKFLNVRFPPVRSISEAYLHCWLKIADRDDGVDRAGSPVTRDESVELREARKQIKLLEQEVEVTRRTVGYVSGGVNSNDVPAGPRPCRVTVYPSR